MIRQPDGGRIEAPAMQLAAVILAAGNGSRLGGVAKALIRLDGVPLVRRLIAALQGAGITDVVVVTGTHHEAIAAAVAPSTARLIRNTDAALGQPGSVRLGLQSTDPRADAVMVLLADQALLTAGDLRDLVAAFGCRSGEAFVVPRVDGALRGNPVMVSRAAVQAILQSTQFIACRDYMDAHPHTVSFMETGNDHYRVDIDLPQDLVTVQSRLGVSVALPEPSDAIGAARSS
jgi:CTP:molybdopterin cytidylyltransferase MocA